MGIPGGDPKEYDYRKLPRKPVDEQRNRRATIAVTTSELEQLREKAAEKGLTMADFIIRRCLGASARPAFRSRRSDT